MSNVIEILFAIVAGAVILYAIYRFFKYFGIDLIEKLLVIRLISLNHRHAKRIVPFSLCRPRKL